MNALTEAAREFALERHHGQIRPLINERPVVEHLAEVAQLVTEAGGTPEMIAAAWLHDVVEDTEATLGEVRELFGDAVAVIVDGLTDPPHFAPMVLHERKALQTARIASQPWEVQVVKVADQTSNVWMVANNPVAACSGIPASLAAEFAAAFKGAHTVHTAHAER